MEGRAGATAAPSAPRSPGLLPDMVLGERYRLLTLVRSTTSGADADYQLWRAEDQVLARRISVRALIGASHEQQSEFMSAAGRAGQLSAPGIARILDADVGILPSAAGGGSRKQAPDRPVEVAYVVSAWIDGQSLETEIRQQGPLEPARAAALTVQLCRCLEAAHHHGVFSLAIDPAQLFLNDDGPSAASEISLLDMGLAAALEISLNDYPQEVLVRQDTIDAVRTLYAALVGSWPDQPTSQPASLDRRYAGLPAAAVRDGRLCLPRQVRAGLPRELDAVVAATLRPRPGQDAIATPRQLREALEESAPVSPAAAEPAPSTTPARPQSRSRRRLRRWITLAVALLTLAGVGIAGWAAGLVVGRVPGTAVQQKTVPGLKVSPSPGASAAAPLEIRNAVSFDPQGDKSEDETDVPNAYDGSSTTSWSTEGYDSATFGGLKTGVGLLIDLGTPTRVTKLVVDAPPGESLQLLAAPGPTAPTTTSPTATPEVSDTAQTGGSASSSTNAPGSGDESETTIQVTHPVTARYYIVWITGLRQGSGQQHSYSAQINELAFYG